MRTTCNYFMKKQSCHEDEMGARKRWLAKESTVSLNLIDTLTSEQFNYAGYGKISWEKGEYLNRKIYAKISTSIFVEDIRPRPVESIQIKLKDVDWSAYNRISLWVYPKSSGFVNFYSHYYLKNRDGSVCTHVESLIPNQWNRVLFEFTKQKVNHLELLGISIFHMGVPDEAIPQVVFYYGDIVVEKVEADYVHGWDLENRIAYSHIGYLTNATKHALVASENSGTFILKDKHDQIIYSGKAVSIESEIGSFSLLDFSDVTREGKYYLEIGNLRTASFPINKTVFQSSIEKSIAFLYRLRCGDDIKGVHSPCHLNCYTTHPDGRIVPNFGGWHDAGDVSQFAICTAEIAHALVDLADSMKDISPLLFKRIINEARYGLNWLLRTRFGDGYRALAVEYSIWQPNVVKDKSTINLNHHGNVRSVGENGAYENFLTASALASGALLFQDIDSNFAQWCKRIACEDFVFGLEGYQKGYFTKRWGVIPDAQIGGEAIQAATLLYKLTQEASYLDVAVQMADLVIQCQEKNYHEDWKYPIRGFFYEDINHTYLLTYEHRGHEQSPIQGLIRLLMTIDQHPNRALWEEAVNLYREYLLSTRFATSPYGLLPAHIYIIGKINPLRFTIPATFNRDQFDDYMNQQIKEGVKLSENAYLRRFPIAITRRGFHATLLSKAKALSMIAMYQNDETLKQMAIDQIEWILGKNPFSSSTMYGEGENYHPLYVAFSRQLIGALPVGIETLGNVDAPYWPVVNNAVYKEVWGHTTGKYLWVLADILKMIK